MKESTFIEKNEQDWLQLEELLNQPNRDADKLLHLFEKVSGDLAYARTYYPNRSIRVYLNNLTQEVLATLAKKRKKFRFADIVHFYKVVLPAEVYRSRNAFYVSFLVFATAIIIGVVSSANVDNFANVVLGDGYVSMTEKNINDGDPMAVYKDMEQGDMFMKITVNNIRVSFLCFVLGLLGSLGTIFVLLANGIMVGAFQYFFYKKGLFLTSFLTIWIHGTIEISSIILAGAAGFILGNGLIFPKSYSRNASLLISAKRSLRIILAIAPLFVIAGFLESFVTRLTEMPTIIKVLIILVSLLVILGIFVIYPIYCVRNGLIDQEQLKGDPVIVEKLDNNKYNYATFGVTLAMAFSRLREVLGAYLKTMFLPAFLTACVVAYFHVQIKANSLDLRSANFVEIYFGFMEGLYALWLTIIIAFLFVWLIMKDQARVITGYEFLKGLKEYFLKVLPMAMYFACLYFFTHSRYVFLILIVVPPHFCFIFLEELSMRRPLSFKVVAEKIGFSIRYWFQFSPITIIASNIIFVFMVFSMFPGVSMLSFLESFVAWHSLFDEWIANRLYIQAVFGFAVYFNMITFLYYAYTYRYGSLLSLEKGTDLREKYAEFGEEKKTYQLQR